jgi:hypothetical protein
MRSNSAVSATVAAGLFSLAIAAQSSLMRRSISVMDKGLIANPSAGQFGQFMQLRAKYISTVPVSVRTGGISASECSSCIPILKEEYCVKRSHYRTATQRLQVRVSWARVQSWSRRCIRFWVTCESAHCVFASLCCMVRSRTLQCNSFVGNPQQNDFGFGLSD